MTPLDDYLLPDDWPTNPAGPPLSAYLLGLCPFDDVLRVQRRLHFDITEDRDQAALILCEHPPLVTVGRHGSARHLQIESRELQWRGWEVRWLQRGGGCWLHLPGQLAVYLLVPLDRLSFFIPDALDRLATALTRILGDFSVRGAIDAGPAGVSVGRRLLAATGLAVRDGVTSFGACFNIHPDLEPYRLVRTYPAPAEPMTSLERERRGAVRPALVRQRLLSHLVELFGFSRVSLFTDHPLLRVKRLADSPRVRAG